MAMLEQTDTVPYAIKKLAGFGESHDPASERVLKELVGNVRALMTGAIPDHANDTKATTGALFLLHAADKAELYGPHVGKLHKACQENLEHTATVLIGVGLGLVRPTEVHRAADRETTNGTLDMSYLLKTVGAIMNRVGEKNSAKTPARQPRRLVGLVVCPC